MTKAEMEALKPGDRVILAWGDVARVMRYRYSGTNQWFLALRFLDCEVCALSAFRPEDIERL